MLYGNKINIRYLKAQEIEAWVTAKNNPSVMGNFSTQQFISLAQIQREFSLNGLSTDAMEVFAIENKFNQMVGTISHFLNANYSSARELGFTIFEPEAINQGFATEAVSLLGKYLFDSKPINRLQIVMPINHIACEKVALKSGFKKEGIIRGLLFIGGEYRDCYLYSLLRSDLI